MLDTELETQDLEPESIYIEAAIAVPVYTNFTYQVPDSLSSFCEIGKRVLVHFNNRKLTGYIIDLKKTTDQSNVKLILDILDKTPLFPASMIPFFKWISDYYLYPLGQVIKSALPDGLEVHDFATACITEIGTFSLENEFITPLEREILNKLKEKGRVRLKSLYRAFYKKLRFSVLNLMEDKGLIEITRKLNKGSARPKMLRYVRLERAAKPDKKLTDLRKKILNALSKTGEMSVSELKAIIPTCPAAIKSMEKKGCISIFEKEIYRDPFGEPISPDRDCPVLTLEQKDVLNSVITSLGKGFKTYLLFGITGSGKTEVYMNAAAHVIEQGNSVLVLVSEIALISQMERQFRARFGDCVAILHSSLSKGERYDQWMRIVRGEVSIAIGARSAIFAPLKKLGLIIVDEEHDLSYKQESGLRYNARDLAVMRAKMEKAVALLGSATPSIQSYYNAMEKKFSELNLTTRVENRLLPEIELVDLKEHQGNYGISRFITSPLKKAIKECLERDEQIMLFINKRGFSNFSICASCGKVLKCKNCDISLTFHKNYGAYKCHYCGFLRPCNTKCNHCGSNKIKKLGMGTEKIEEAVSAMFPDARVARMDQDTTRRKGSAIKILKDLRNHNIDILVGTQMIAKGHDFPGITLVGIICADMTLNFPDFRAGERTFQLLAQVAGRAGRGDRPGRVILQTYNPENFTISTARDQDYKTFYKQELSYRKILNYPPFSRMVQIKISGRNKFKTEDSANAIGEYCHVMRKAKSLYENTIEILGPVTAPLARIANRYRWLILLKGLEIIALHEFVRRLLFERISPLKNRYIRVIIDVDPVSMM
ncbi:Primosomal protein N' [Candidatus Magnetomoraceae bacterium gMMP-15]